MPTYDYKCNACGHLWEEFQSIMAEATKKCPECKKKKAERVISAGGGILFKGSGFYITDYRSDSYKNAAKADSSSSSSSGSGSKSDSGSKSESSSSKTESTGGKSDSKPATKSGD